MAIQFGDSFSGTISADAFRGTLNASDLTQGTIPAARFPTSGVNATAIGDGSVTNTEFQALSTVTSNIQTQLNNRVVVNTAFATLTSTGDLTIADRIAHSGDVDTAIRFSSNDTVSVDTAGTEKLRITSAGNVGIGAITPSERLTVSGNISATGRIFGTGWLQINSDIGATTEGGQLTLMDSSGVGAWEIDNRSQSFRIFRDKGVNDITAINILNTGNVGIGATSPNQRLTVSGNISASGDIFASGNNNTLNRLTVTGNSSFGQAISANSTIRSLTETFDVNKLPVTSNAQVVYNLASFRYNTSNFTGAIVFTAPVLLETIMHWMEIDGFFYNNVGPFKCVIQGYKTSIWNTTGLYKQLLSDYDIPMFWGVAPNGNSCLILSGTDLDWPQIHITKAMFSHSNGGNTSYSERWSVSAVNTLDGFTGLSAIPTVTKFKDLTITESGVVDVNSVNAALRITQRGSGNALVVEDSTTPDTTPFVITSAGNVGIGTTTPADTLTVQKAGGIGGILVNNGYEAGVQLNSTGAGGVQWDILSSPTVSPLLSGTLSFYNRTFANVNPTLVIAPSGNIGVGVQSPEAKLHVRSNGGVYTNPASNNNSTIYVENLNTTSTGNAIVAVRTNGANAGDPFISYDINGVIGWSTGIDNSDGDKFKIANSWSNVDTTTRLTIDSSGNVGVGATSPTAKLDVRGGNIYLNGQLSFANNSGVPFLDNWIGRYNDGTTDWLHIGGITTSSVRRIGMYANLIYLEGNVGIGTTTPTAKLDVVGQMRLQASATASAATQIPVFTASPASTSQTLATRTPAEILADGGISLYMPAGAVQAFARSTAPAGWLVCDGTIIPTTGTFQGVNASLLQTLRTLLATNFGATGQLPNLQGQFIRGLTTNLTTTSRDPLSASRVLGNVQSDIVRSHTHTGTTDTGGAHAHNTNIVIGSTGAGSALMAANAAANEFPTGRIAVQSGGSHNHSFTTSSTGDLETRPVNIALLYCIKY